MSVLQRTQSWPWAQWNSPRPSPSLDLTRCSSAIWGTSPVRLPLQFDVYACRLFFFSFWLIHAAVSPFADYPLLSQAMWKSWMELRRTLWRFLKTSLWSTRSAWCCSRWAVGSGRVQDFALFRLAQSPCCDVRYLHPTALSLYIPFQWIANPLNDMYADAVTTVVLEVQSNPKAQKGRFLNVVWTAGRIFKKCFILFIFIKFVLISCDSNCVLLTVMETQTAIMDMDVFQTRLGVMLQWVTLTLSRYLHVLI